VVSDSGRWNQDENTKPFGAQTYDAEGLARWATNNQVNSAKLPEEILTDHLTHVSFDKNTLV